MTSPNPKAVSDISKIVEALERCKQLVPSQYMDIPNAALLLARSLAEQWDEMVEAKNGLEWLIKRDYLPFHHGRSMLASAMSVINDTNCPTVIKRYLEGK